MPVDITFYFLYLLEPKGALREDYDEISKNVMKNTCDLRKLYDIKKIETIHDHDPDEWFKSSIKLDDEYDAQIYYYKERLIVKIITKSNNEGLNQLFKEAKKTRKTLLINEYISLEKIEKKFNACQSCIKSIYLYPLIEIGKDYKEDEADFDWKLEAITTFYYEVPDVGDMDKIFFGCFPIKYKDVLMRVSGPSIIATKMSDKMRAKLINVIYESALYKMRETERENHYWYPCKKVFGDNYEYLRNYIAETFFSIESESSQIEMTSSLHILSYISAFGALAGICAISYAIYILPLTLESLKTIAAIILFVLTIVMLIFVMKIIPRLKKWLDDP